MALIQLRGITVAFGGPPVLDDVNLVLEPGERWALLGRNGAGKSTLMGVIEGRVEPDAGTVQVGRSTRIAMLRQTIDTDAATVVKDLVCAGGGGVAEHAADAAITRVGLQGDATFASLSAGLQRRALLARALAQDPDVLLLDEPTNHLDLPSIRWLERFLLRQSLTLLFVTHDRAFLRAVATGILDLDRGQLTRWPADYDAFRVAKEHAIEVEGRQRAAIDKKHAQEETWIRQGVRERRKRNIGRVRRLQDMRHARRARRDAAGQARMEAECAVRSGRIVLRAKDVAFGYGDAPLFAGVNLEILRGDRLGVLGPNGAGKSTLLRVLFGELEPTHGQVEQGTRLAVGVFDQLHEAFDESATVAEIVSGGTPVLRIGGKERHVISYLRDFLFTPEQAKRGITHLSGGERNRLALARLLARPTNVLVLDEPTNDLDVETLEVLEGVLESYEGTLIVVSHDREFLEQTVDALLVVEGDGRVRYVVGGPSVLEREAAARRAEAKQASRKADAAASSVREASAPPAPALTKVERARLRALPAEIERLEAKRASMHAAMADPAFFRQSGDTIATARADLSSCEAAIEAAYAAWEDLESRAAKARGR